ncbi:hypothetical protein AHiyo6_20450 [Arthrobacter sp. Hiyo6]|nr:hypothetical protein AHiyo6_20450 [Arthrobacter sp. Hiyo6]
MPATGAAVIRKVIQVVGELLMTVGIVLLLFVAWQLWWTNVESNAKQSEVIKDFAQNLAVLGGNPVPAPAATSPVDYGPPKVAEAPGHGVTIGIMYIPRFGADYTRPIVQAPQPMYWTPSV